METVLEGQLFSVKEEASISAATKLFFDVSSGWNSFPMSSRHHTTGLYILLYSLFELNGRHLVFLLLVLGRSCLSHTAVIIIS
jgi:hypothetical protein